ncbi:hypothetical protein ANO11243_096950 [Dothideomycetidae sp. 11243]|nr:hypothetical protein ANO11243_096950 [fungal sp. No.11243]
MSPSNGSGHHHKYETTEREPRTHAHRTQHEDDDGSVHDVKKDDGDSRSNIDRSTSSRHSGQHDDDRRRDTGRRGDDYGRSRGDRPGPSHGDHYRRRSRSPYDRYSGDSGHSGRGGDRYSGRSGYSNDDYDDRRRRRSDDRDRYRARSPPRRSDPGWNGRSGKDHARRYDHKDGSAGGKRNATPEPTDDERDRRTVFCQQLAAAIRTRDLERFFAPCGTVIEAQIVRDRVSNRSKGIAYVEFKDESSVEEALNLTGHQLLKIPIIVQRTEAEKNRIARKPENQPTLSNGIPFQRLYIGNVHFNITEDDLRAIFETYGEVEVVQLQTDDNGRSRGHGFVQYTNPDDAKQALGELNSFDIAGRPLRVGLGTDKLHQETATAMMQRHNQSTANAQGSAFSGTGGRGAHAGGSVNFSSRDDKSALGLSALDDSDVGGVNYSNFSRESLMKKLARTEEPASEDRGKSNTKVATSKLPLASYKPSRCILIKHAYTSNTLMDAEWEADTVRDFTEECSNKYGHVVHCGLSDDRSEGQVYVKFKDLKGGDNALKGLNGRLFDGRPITAAPVVDAIYHHMFPEARDL